MAKTKIRMRVGSAEVWGANGQVIEALSLRAGSAGDAMSAMPMDTYSPSHSMSLYFPQGEGLSQFPVDSEVDVTIEPVKGDG